MKDTIYTCDVCKDKITSGYGYNIVNDSKGISVQHVENFENHSYDKHTCSESKCVYANTIRLLQGVLVCKKK